MGLTLEIVTPEGTLINQEADSVVLPTSMGETGILPGHIPWLITVQRGELKVMTGGSVDHIAVSDGFALVIGDHVSVLTEGAIDVKDIDLAQVEEARKRAEIALEEAKNRQMDPVELEKMETRVQFLMAQKLTKERKY